MSWKIVFYQTAKGRIPVWEFLEQLERDNPKLQVKVLRNIELLEKRGVRLSHPFVKAVGDGLFELRSQFSSNISRIFYFFVAGEKIVLTNGFVKKTPKIPSSELEKAKRYKKDYEEKNENDGLS